MLKMYHYISRKGSLVNKSLLLSYYIKVKKKPFIFVDCIAHIRIMKEYSRFHDLDS